MPEMEPRSTTYGALKDGDVIVDKAGGKWLVDHVRSEADGCTFWLADPTTKVRTHHVTKPRVERATVLRPATHAEEVAEAEADAPDLVTEEEALAAEEIVEALDAEVIAEETAEEHDARVAATGDSPVVLPTFEEMTDLEKRSHLYLVHGVYAEDVKFREALVELHVESHGAERIAFPHEHVAGAPVPTEDADR